MQEPVPGISAVPDEQNARYFHVVVAGKIYFLKKIECVRFHEIFKIPISAKPRLKYFFSPKNCLYLIYILPSKNSIICYYEK